MIIRKCRIEDIDRIKEVVLNSPGLILHDHYTYWMLLYNFRNTCYLAEHNNEMIGFITGMKNEFYNDVFFIWQIGIMPKHRRKGYATKLIRTLVESVTKQNYKKVHFTIESLNKPSQCLFANFAKQEGYQLNKIKEIKANKFLYEIAIK